MKSEQLLNMMDCLRKEEIVSLNDLSEVHATVNPFLPNAYANKILTNLRFFEKYFSKNCQRLDGNMMHVQGDMQKVLLNILSNTNKLLKQKEEG